MSKNKKNPLDALSLKAQSMLFWTRVIKTDSLAPALELQHHGLARVTIIDTGPINGEYVPFFQLVPTLKARDLEDAGEWERPYKAGRELENIRRAIKNTCTHQASSLL